MYKTRQNKEKVSRRIDSADSKSKITNKQNVFFMQEYSSKCHNPIQRSYEVRYSEQQFLNKKVPVARTVDVKLIPDNNGAQGSSPGSSNFMIYS